ncbi:hypothetical protein ACPCTO_36730 [Streptomyces olivoreticuli]
MTEQLTASARERRHGRWIGLLGLSPLSAAIVMLSLGRFPVPDCNLPGQVYLDYIANHTAEVQVIVTLAAAVTSLTFMTLLASIYTRLAGRPILASRLITSGITAYVAVSTVSVGGYAGIILLARGYPSFGTDPVDLKLITLTWDLGNATYALNGGVLAMVWIAIAVVNRTHPVLPRALGHWGAIFVAVINAASLGTVFIYTGPWAPSDTATFITQTGITYAWIATTGVVLIRSSSAPPGVASRANS